MKHELPTPSEREHIAGLYQLLLDPTSSLSEVKQTKKQLHLLLEKGSARCWDVEEHRVGVKNILEALRIESDEKRLVELFRMIGSMFYYFGAPPEFYSEIKQLILSSLLHENGYIRDTVKRIINNWRLHDISTSLQEPSALTIAFITELVALIRKYTPTDVETPIEQRPPSVYKSLLLAYEEIVRGATIEYFIHNHPELYVDIPYEEFTPVYDRGTQLPLLWKIHSCTDETKDHARILAEKAQSRLVTFLHASKFSTAEIVSIRSRLAVAHVPYEQEAVVEYIVRLAEKKQIPAHELGPIVRELQAVTSHTLRTENITPFTYVLLGARAGWTEEKRPNNVDWNAWMDYVFNVHTAVDEFCDVVQSSRKTMLNDIATRLASVGVYDDVTEIGDFTHTLEIDVLDSVSIAHHIVDWVLQSYPSFTSKPPKKLAAICYGLVRELNFGAVQFSAEDIALFGGWKSTTSILESVRTVQRMLEEVVTDPTLFLTCASVTLALDEAMETVSSPLGAVAPQFGRFYVVVSSARPISMIEHARLHQACETEASSGSCIVESTAPYDTYAVLVLGINEDIAPQSVIDNIIIAANATEPFLRFHFLITNSHVPTPAEIKKYIDSF